MVYRDDIGALEARLAARESELGAKRLERDEAAHLLAAARTHARHAALAADWAAGGPEQRRFACLVIAAFSACVLMMVALAAVRTVTRTSPTSLCVP